MKKTLLVGGLFLSLVGCATASGSTKPTTHSVSNSLSYQVIYPVVHGAKVPCVVVGTNDNGSGYGDAGYAAISCDWNR